MVILFFKIVFIDSFIKFPSCIHDSRKFLIAVNRAADVPVVLAEFVEGNNAIFLLGVPERHELHVHILFCFTSIHNIWMALDVIDSSDVI